jgi:hypothetical protein
MKEGFDTAQICLNGHLINRCAVLIPIDNKKFCQKCGVKTITACPKCNEYIKGEYHYPNQTKPDLHYVIPKCCDNCGNPYPWTETMIKCASELIGFSDKIEPSELIDFSSNISDLILETARVPIAQLKIKKYLEKAGPVLSENIHQILSESISDKIKEFIWK